MSAAPQDLPEGEPPRIGVLAVQGGVAEHLRALTEVGADPVPVRRAVELAGVDGLVLPGGESTTISRLLVAFDLLDPLREAVADGFPVYGSCAGLILLAAGVLDGRPDQQQVGGLDVTVRRNAFGRQVQSAEAELEFAGIRDPGRPVHAVFIRAPWVERVGPGVEVLARMPAAPEPLSHGRPHGDAVELDPVLVAAGRVVAVRSGALLGTAFHPELTGDLRVHETFVSMVAAARG